jgi:hypothetical protein
LICDTETGTSGAEDYHAQILELLVTGLETGHDGGESHATGSLDIIVEASKVRTVTFQNLPRYIQVSTFLSNLVGCLTVAEAKVLEMDISVWIELPRGLNEFVDKLGILFATDTLLLQTEI